MPCITYALRGIVGRASGRARARRCRSTAAWRGGALPDAAIALNAHPRAAVLGQRADSRFRGSTTRCDRSARRRSTASKKLPFDEATRSAKNSASCRHDPPRHGSRIHASTTRRGGGRRPPSSRRRRARSRARRTQVLPKASAIVSCRIVPDQEPEKVIARV